MIADGRLAVFADEGGDGGFQLGGDLDQHRGRDPVGAALVLLNLLEGDPEGIGQLCLAEAQPTTANADARANRDVDWVRTLARHGHRFESPMLNC